jgi:hypothetical protein
VLFEDRSNIASREVKKGARLWGRRWDIIILKK